jgi:hypothetical protein
MVSPAVFTRESTVTALPQGIAEIGAAFIGPTSKGPAFKPTIVESRLDFENNFGVPGVDSYLPFAVEEYLTSSGRATIVRILGLVGYDNTAIKSVLISLSGSEGKFPLAVIHPTVLGGSIISGSVSGSAPSFALTLSSSLGLKTFTSLSADVNSPNYFGNIYGNESLGSKGGYYYAEFPRALSLFAASASAAVIVEPIAGLLNFSGSYGVYSNATTPVIRSQTIGSTRLDLFTISTFNDGTSANTELKVSITNVKAGTLSTDYGTFSISVRDFNDTDSKQNILEQFDNLNLNSDSPDYVARRIGSSKISFDATGTPYLDGDFPTVSNYIYIQMIAGSQSLPNTALPFGFGPLNPPLGLTTVPAPLYVSSSYSTPAGNVTAVKGKSYYGLLFTDRTNLAYLKGLPSGSAALNAAGDVGFNLENLAAVDLTDLASATSLSAASLLRKFTVPFQGGFDGIAPNTFKAMGTDIVSTNTQGYDLSDSSKGGAKSYIKAINAVGNSEEYDINMLVMPGVINSKHSYITSAAIAMVENRQDAFYIMDADSLDATVTSVVSSVSTVDSSYTGVYHPWVKVHNASNGQLVWVPPSVVMPGIFAFNDKVGAEWFAPAGLSRGGITSAVQVKSRLTHEDRDVLYDGRVNAIATFPGQGIAAFGQKTLQAVPGALDRINVRRLLIAVKKFISSASRYLVFEQNVDSTRQKFLNIVNPYLASVQERSGLYAFRVVMDDSNNTPDTIDRNILVGLIQLQPTKTAEFISLDFSIQPTGATFSNV